MVREFKEDLEPYSDGSGHRYQITVATRNDGHSVIVIHSSET